MASDNVTGLLSGKAVLVTGGDATGVGRVETEPWQDASSSLAVLGKYKGRSLR
jgi:hypothetical protein